MAVEVYTGELDPPASRKVAEPYDGELDPIKEEAPPVRDSMRQQFFSGANELIGEQVSAGWNAGKSLRVGGIPFGKVIDAASWQSPMPFWEQSLGDWYERTFVGPEPATVMGRAMRRAGEGTVMAVEAAVPFAAAAKVAPLVAQTTAETSAATRVGRALVEPFVTAPKATTALTAVSGASAGMGEQLGREAYPESEIAPTIGGLLGGVAPTFLPWLGRNLPLVKTISKVAGAVRQRATPEGRAVLDAAQVKEAQRQIRTVASVPDAQAEIARTRALREEIGLAGDVDFTIAQRTNSPRLLTDQIKAEQAISGSALDAAVKRKAGVLQRIKEYEERQAPVSPGDPAAVAQRAARDRVQTSLRKIAGQREEAEAMLAESAAELPRANRAELGQKIRSDMLASREATKKELQALAEANGLNEGEVQFPVKSLEDAVTEAFGAKPLGTAPPPIIGKLRTYIEAQRAPAEPTTSPIDLSKAPSMAAGGDEAEMIGWQDLQDLRTQISDELATVAASSAPDKNRRLADLLRLRRTVDKFTDTAAPQADPAKPELPAKWKEFRTRWRTEYADVYERGRVYKVLKPGARATYQTEDEKVAETFLTPTGKRQFLAAGGNPVDLRATAVDRLSSAVRPNGTFNVTKYQQEYAKIKDALPLQVAAELGAKGTAAQAVAKRMATLKLREAKVKQATLARALRRTGRDPDAYVRLAIKNPDLMEQAAQTARASGTEDALRAAVWAEAFPEGQINTESIRKFLDTNKKSLAMVMDDRHIDAIKTISDAVDVEARITPTRGAAEEATSAIGEVEGATGITVPSLFSRLRSVAAGRMNADYMYVDITSTFWRHSVKAAREAARAEALTDPKFADALSIVLKDDASPSALKRLGDFLKPDGLRDPMLWMWQLGYPPAESAEPEAPEGEQ